MPPLQSSFASLGVPSDIVAALDRKSITEPFPIQTATIPDVLGGRDVCGKAPTGSGKTLAFGIGARRLASRGRPSRPRHPRVPGPDPHPRNGCPSGQRAAGTGHAAPVSESTPSTGGVGYGPSAEGPVTGRRRGRGLPRPTGRSHREGKSFFLDAVEIVVLDEADRMADMGIRDMFGGLLDLTPWRTARRCCSPQPLMATSTCWCAVTRTIRLSSRARGRPG